MKRLRRGLIGYGIVMCLCCGGPLLWLSTPSQRFKAGANINDLGLTRDNTRYYIWSPEVREPIADFARRNQVNLAHFFGSIKLSRPGQRWDGVELQFLDGKTAYIHGPYDDEALTKDLKVLGKGRLSDMLAQTTNDWRIANHNNHTVDPKGAFTGEITINLRSGYPFTTVTILDVANDRITKSRRSILFTVD